jgi:beta-glucosidase
MKTYRFLFLLTAAVLVGPEAYAQVAPSAVTNASEVVARTNSAVIPIRRPEAGAQRRTDLVLQRAKESPGPCDIIFIGDSITQQWENSGRNVWEKYYGSRKALNFGVSGDRTQHALWRFENGQLDGLKPKAAVVMIGTNNSNRDDNSAADILEGVQAVVAGLRQRLPDTRILLVAIFPRSRSFTDQRGKLAQVNQVLAKLDDGKMVRFLDIGPQLLESNGEISNRIMPDALHLSEAGYEIWAAAMEPLLAEMLK